MRNRASAPGTNVKAAMHLRSCWRDKDGLPAMPERVTRRRSVSQVALRTTRGLILSDSSAACSALDDIPGATTGGVCVAFR
eukprot:6462612-Amphidinium_carterae.1